MREDAEGNKSPQLDADGNPMYRELDSADYEILGRDKQVGAEMRDGVVVSNSFNDRFIGMSPEKQQETLGKLVDDDFHVRRAEGMKGSRPEVTIPATFKTQDLDEVTEIRPRSQPDIDNLNDLATRRKAEIGNPSELRGYSEQIGEAAADAHANVHGLTPIYTGSGAYTLDKVYQKGDTFYVFEAKGGGSTLGGKKVDIINEATGDLHIAEQGSREYLEKTIQDMANSRDLRKMEMAEDLQNALDRGKVKYMVVQQKLTKAGDIGEFTIKEFDITK